MYNKKIGNIGENIALGYLKAKGFEIIEKKYIIAGGEIDLICLDQDEVVFVEVKARKSDDFGYPEDAVTKRKASHLARTAKIWLMKHSYREEFYRFDIIAILLDGNNEAKEIKHFENAIMF